MATDVLKYDLPDLTILNSEASTEVCVWQPDKTYLVLGQSNRAETALFTDKVTADNIPVYKRPSGGETVILTPHMLVIAVSFKEIKLQNPAVYFKKINDTLISVLAENGFTGLSQKGISDISRGPKKILGSSIYRKPGRVFYHAVLNVAEDPGVIAKYIRHPQKEPDYRQGRAHEDFVTSLINSSDNNNIIRELKTTLEYRLQVLNFQQ